MGARTLYTLGKFEEAGQWARQSNDIAQAERWTAFRPWAEAWVAHADLALGRDPAQVRRDLEGTYAMSCQLGDACWEGLSAKVMALAFHMQGAHGEAIDWLRTARASCRRVTDFYSWVQIDVALTEAEFARDRGEATLARDLAEHVVNDAARYGMDGMLERAKAVREAVREAVR